LSQGQLALALGVTRNTLARWERGELAIANPRLIGLALERIEADGRTSDAPPLPSAATSFIGREVEV
jgi:transcriptional regulator with XRE-family HTH domain